MTVVGDSQVQAPGHLRETGARIEALLDASSAGGVVARERAEELVRLTTDLYGAGLERMLDLLYDMGRLDDDLLDALAADELISGLLLVHGLHPYDVAKRVADALDSVRPYLQSHGGDVALLDVGHEGVVRLQLLGSCDGCASSSVTLELAVKDAVEAAAPEVTSIEVVATGTGAASGTHGHGRGFIPVSALRTRLGGPPGDPLAALPAGSWQALPTPRELTSGEVRQMDVAGLRIVLARLGAEHYAYRDRCGRCTGSLGQARLERRLGGASGDGVLRCESCGAHFDARRAGVGLDSESERLEPLPLLRRDGALVVALPAVSA